MRQPAGREARVHRMARAASCANEKPMALALRGTLLTPLAEGGTQFEVDGLLLCDAEGTIRYAGPFRGAGYRGAVDDVRPNLITPGFIDVHAHFPQTRIIGCATGPLLDWLANSVFPEEARFTRPAYAKAVAAELVQRLLHAGTTTVALFSSSSPSATETCFSALAEAGLRGLVGLTWMDRNCPEVLRITTTSAVAASERLIRRWHGFDHDRLRFAVTPRFALSCSKTMLRRAGDLANAHDLPVQTHIAENDREGEATLRAHPYATSYLDVYDQAGLLGPRTILAHAIHLKKRDWDRIGESDATVAHCPDSNFFLGSGRMRLNPPRSRGVRVGLGSDVAAGRSFSMRRAMGSAYDNALAVGEPVAPSELLRLATFGGAEVLGCAATTGSLQLGKEADLLIVPLARAAANLDAALASLIFDTDNLGVLRSYVRGRRLF